MRTCREIQYALPDFITGDIGTDEMTVVHDHLLTCPSCIVDLQQLKLLLGELDQVQPEAPSQAYWASVLPRIHARLDANVAWSIPTWIQYLALPAASAIVLLIVMINIIPQGNDDKSKDVQSVIQQLKPEELQVVGDQQTVTGVLEAPVLSVDRALTVDPDVLKEVLQDEDHRAVYADFDPSIVTESMTDQDAQELVAILERSSFN